MPFAVPFSAAFGWLLLAAPFVWLLGRAVAHSVCRERAARPALSVGLALSLWFAAVHTASLAARSLLVGLPAATLALAGAGVVAEIRRRRRPSPGQGEGASAWMGVSAALVTAAVAPVVLDYNLHDEILLTGHLSIASELQNGVYPPRHIAFPDTPLRYHYGFDVVTASLGLALRVRVDRAIDAATLGLFALSWCLLWTIGQRLAGRAGAWLVPVCSLLSGGLPLVCDNHPELSASHVVDFCTADKIIMNAPTVSYFMQHPWGLGIPVALTAILVLTCRRPRSEPLRLAVLGVCLAALSMSQVVLFAACVPTFVVVEAWGPAGLVPRRGARAAVVAVAVIVVARAFGGFFTPLPGVPGLEFSVRAGFGSTLRETLVWNAQSLGALLPVGLVGLAAMRSERLLFGLLAAGSLTVLNTVQYKNSPDIMKFGTLAAIALGVMSGATLAGWMSRRGPGEARPWRPVHLLAPALAVALACLCCLSSGVFLAFMGAHWRGVPAWTTLRAQEPTADEARAIAWLRLHVQPGELVYRNASRTYAFASWGGLPQPWIQWSVWAFGFPAERIRTRERLLRGKPASPEDYRREGFRYLVLDGSREDEALLKAARGWILDGYARQVTAFGPLRVVELTTQR